MRENAFIHSFYLCSLERERSDSSREVTREMTIFEEERENERGIIEKWEKM